VELQFSDLMVTHAKRTPNQDTSTTGRWTCSRMASRYRCSTRQDSEHPHIEPDLSSTLTCESLAKRKFQGRRPDFEDESGL
jgi:hypothetical protein